MDINSLKNKIFDEASMVITLTSDEFPVPESVMYLVYHYVGSSRRYDCFAYTYNSALDFARQLSRNNIDMKYHVVRLNITSHYEYCVESFKN